MAVASTPQFAAIELSHVTNNTLTGSGGVLSIGGEPLAFATYAQTLTNKTIDGDNNTLQDILYSQIKSTSRSGSDVDLVTGTAGTSGHCGQWNSDGDLVTSGAACGGAVSVSDDELSNDNQEIVFTTDNTNLESDGDFHYNPSTGTATATAFATTVTETPILTLDDTTGDDFKIDASASGEASFSIGTDGGGWNEIFNIDTTDIQTDEPIVSTAPITGTVLTGTTLTASSSDSGILLDIVTANEDLTSTEPNTMRKDFHMSSNANANVEFELQTSGLDGSSAARVFTFYNGESDDAPGNYDLIIDPNSTDQIILVGTGACGAGTPVYLGQTGFVMLIGVSTSIWKAFSGGPVDCTTQQ